MKLLVLLGTLSIACDPRGTVGDGCYYNDTCNDGLICVRWKDSGKFDKSVCANPRTLVVGGFVVPKVCPDPPDAACAPCEPGWKRGAR